MNRASNPPPSAMVARASRSVRDWSWRTRAAAARATRSPAPPPPPARYQRRQENVLPAPSARGLDHPGQRPGEGPLAQRGDLRSDDVPIDGMGEPHFDTAAVPAAGDQALALKRRDGRGVGQLVQPGLAERLAQG